MKTQHTFTNKFIYTFVNMKILVYIHIYIYDRIFVIKSNCEGWGSKTQEYTIYIQGFPSRMVFFDMKPTL